MDTPYFDHCNSLPITSTSVTFQYQLKQLISLFQHTVIKQFQNLKTWIKKFQKNQINKSKWDFVPWNVLSTEISQTHPAAKLEYSLKATSRSTFVTELSQLGCRHTCKRDSSKKVSLTWEWGRAGTRVLVVLIWRSWTHTHTYTRNC